MTGDPNIHIVICFKRLNDNYFIINKPHAPNLQRTETAFLLQLLGMVKIFNIRCQCSLDHFKTILKTYYFNKTFEDVQDCDAIKKRIKKKKSGSGYFV